MRNRVDISLGDEEAEYFTRCARIRNLNRTSLLRRLLVIIAQDKMVGSILDDDTELRLRFKGEHRFRGPPL